MNSGIYIIKNKINQKFYIGLSVDLKRRFSEHKTPRRANKNNAIYKAVKKYGIENFDFDVLEYVDDFSLLSEKEIFWIEKLNPQYNMTKGGLGLKGVSLNDEQKKHLSKKGKKQWEKKTDNERKNIIKNNLTGPTVGTPRTEETKLKLRIANLGKKQSKETIEKRVKKLKGIKRENKYLFKIVSAIKDNDIVKTFDSVTEASIYCQIHPSGITKVLKGHRKKAGGFEWKYNN